MSTTTPITPAPLLASLAVAAALALTTAVHTARLSLPAARAHGFPEHEQHRQVSRERVYSLGLPPNVYDPVGLATSMSRDYYEGVDTSAYGTCVHTFRLPALLGPHMEVHCSSDLPRSKDLREALLPFERGERIRPSYVCEMVHSPDATCTTQNTREPPAVRQFFLNHTVNGEDGSDAFWVLSDVDEDKAMAVIRSWAVLPSHTEYVSHLARWVVGDLPSFAEEHKLEKYRNDFGEMEEVDPVHFSCAKNTREFSFYVETEEPDMGVMLDGYYFPVAVHEETGRRVYFGASSGLFVWYLAELDRWMVGPLDDLFTSSGYAYADHVKHDFETHGAWYALAKDPDVGWMPITTLRIMRSDRLAISLFVAWAADTATSMHAVKEQPKIHSFRFRNNYPVPTLFFGTGMLQPGNETRDAVKVALEAGYVGYDTARAYGNEWDIRDAMDAWGADRKKVVLQSKVWPTELGFQRTLDSFHQSAEALRSPRIDILLLHWLKCHAEWNVEWCVFGFGTLRVCVCVCLAAP